MWHRWLGILAVGAAFLHTETVDDLLNGIRGAGRDLAELGAHEAATHGLGLKFPIARVFRHHGLL